MKSYIRKYRCFANGCPGRSAHKEHPIPVFKIEYPVNDRYLELINILPVLIKSDHIISAKDLWQRYLAIYPNGYRRSTFCQHFSKWAKDSKVTLHNYSQVSDIPTEDLKILKRWRNSSDRRKWERAVVERNQG